MTFPLLKGSSKTAGVVALTAPNRQEDSEMTKRLVTSGNTDHLEVTTIALRLFEAIARSCPYPVPSIILIDIPEYTRSVAFISLASIVVGEAPLPINGPAYSKR